MSNKTQSGDTDREETACCDFLGSGGNDFVGCVFVSKLPVYVGKWNHLWSDMNFDPLKSSEEVQTQQLIPAFKLKVNEKW